MKVEAGETPDEIIKKSVNIIETIEDETLKADSIVSMSLMAEGKYSRSLIKKYVRREILMKSTLYEEWIAEDIKEASEIATERATIENSRDTLIFLLESKFDFISKSIRNEIKDIDNLSILKGLTKNVLTVSSIEEFEELLEEVKDLD